MLYIKSNGRRQRTPAVVIFDSKEDAENRPQMSESPPKDDAENRPHFTPRNNLCRNMHWNMRSTCLHRIGTYIGYLSSYRTRWDRLISP